MSFLVSIIPGIGIACATIMLILGANQWWIYRNTAYRRSRAISLFCLCSSLFALEHCFVQSRVFSGEFLLNYIYISTFSLCLGMVFYIKALNYFIAVPKWLYRLYIYGASCLVLTTVVAALAHAFFDIHWFFDHTKQFTSDNYFINSYALKLGMPVILINIIMSCSCIITVIGSMVMWKNVFYSSRDFYFMVGLFISVVASVTENFLLPFTLDYFVPMIFYSNLFEAFRMNNLAHYEFLYEKRNSRGETLTEAEESEKYQNSNLTEERIAMLADKIKHLLEIEKVFINPNLSSEDLARKIGIPTYQLSQVVNIGLKTTFFELLSQYRINHVKKLFEDKEYFNSTIINIAYDSGFNSKSAFNTAFKKQTGMTPSAYRKQIGQSI